MVKIATKTILLYTLLPLVILGGVIVLHFIPSLFALEMVIAFSLILVLLFMWRRHVRRKQSKGISVVLITLWIFTCLAVTGVRFFLGHDGQWFSNMKLYQSKSLLQEWTSTDQQTHIYVFGATGLLMHSESVWLSSGNSVFMKRIWNVPQGVVDSISETESEIRIYGEERYPWMKPILITYFPSNELFDIREDSTRNRGISAPEL